jgi:putative membrane protein
VSDLPPPDAAAGSVDDQDRAVLADPARQSPVAVVFMAWKFIKGLGMVNIGLALAFLISGRLPSQLLAAGLVAAMVGAVLVVIAWWRFTFSVVGGELLVRKGILAEEKLTIPLDRVQSVSIDQKFLHRFVGLVSASVDTAGSSTAEFELSAIDRPRAEALQRLAAGHRRSAVASSGPEAVVGVDGVGTGPVVDEAAQAEELIVRTPGQLIRIGLSSWPWAGLVALAPLGAVAGDLAEQLPFGESLWNALPVDDLPDEFGTTLVAVVIGLALFAVVAAALLGAILQMAQQLVSNWDLRLIRTSTGLRRTAGLFNKTSRASTVSRIQALQTDRTPMQRTFGFVKLTMPTVGEGDLIIPGTDDGELATMRSVLFGRPDPPVLDRMISPLYIFLAVRNQALIVVPLAVAAAVLIDWRLVVLLAIVPLRWLVARREWKLRRWSCSADRVAEAYEFVNRHTAEFDLIKTQSAEISRSFFERRRGLATVTLRTAEGFLAVPLIPLADAEAVRDRALFAVESQRRSFM